jgi:hypothetical protein
MATPAPGAEDCTVRMPFVRIPVDFAEATGVDPVEDLRRTVVKARHAGPDGRQVRSIRRRMAIPSVRGSDPRPRGARSPPQRGPPPLRRGVRSPPPRDLIPSATGSLPVITAVRPRLAPHRTPVSHSHSCYLIRDLLVGIPPSIHVEKFLLRSRISLASLASVCPERLRAPLLSRFASRHPSCRRASTEPLRPRNDEAEQAREAENGTSWRIA